MNGKLYTYATILCAQIYLSILILQLMGERMVVDIALLFTVIPFFQILIFFSTIRDKYTHAGKLKRWVLPVAHCIWALGILSHMVIGHPEIAIGCLFIYGFTHYLLTRLGKSKRKISTGDQGLQWLYGFSVIIVIIGFMIVISDDTNTDMALFLLFQGISLAILTKLSLDFKTKSVKIAWPFPEDIDLKTMLSQITWKHPQIAIRILNHFSNHPDPKLIPLLKSCETEFPLSNFNLSATDQQNLQLLDTKIDTIIRSITRAQLLGDLKMVNLWCPNCHKRPLYAYNMAEDKPICQSCQGKHGLIAGVIEIRGVNGQVELIPDQQGILYLRTWNVRTRTFIPAPFNTLIVSPDPQMNFDWYFSAMLDWAKGRKIIEKTPLKILLDERINISENTTRLLKAAENENILVLKYVRQPNPISQQVSSGNAKATYFNKKTATQNHKEVKPSKFLGDLFLYGVLIFNILWFIGLIFTSPIKAHLTVLQLLGIVGNVHTLLFLTVAHYYNLYKPITTGKVASLVFLIGLWVTGATISIILIGFPVFFALIVCTLASVWIVSSLFKVTRKKEFNTMLLLASALAFLIFFIYPLTIPTDLNHNFKFPSVFINTLLIGLQIMAIWHLGTRNTTVSKKIKPEIPPITQANIKQYAALMNWRNPSIALAMLDQFITQPTKFIIPYLDEFQNSFPLLVIQLSTQEQKVLNVMDQKIKTIKENLNSIDTEMPPTTIPEIQLPTYLNNAWCLKCNIRPIEREQNLHNYQICPSCNQHDHLIPDVAWAVGVTQDYSKTPNLNEILYVNTWDATGKHFIPGKYDHLIITHNPEMDMDWYISTMINWTQETAPSRPQPMTIILKGNITLSENSKALLKSAQKKNIIKVVHRMN